MGSYTAAAYTHRVCLTTACPVVFAALRAANKT